MIQFLYRKQINIKKYDKCIEESIQSRVFAFSWYLDIVSPKWGVLVHGDYDAVMPVPLKSKFGFTYVHHPFWTLELGIFSKNSSVDFSEFIGVLKKKYSYINLRLNSDNNLKSNKELFHEKYFQILELNVEVHKIIDGFRKDRKKDLRKAKEANLSSEWNTNPRYLINLFKNNISEKTPYLKSKNFDQLEDLIAACVKRKIGELCTLKDFKGQIIASGFYLKHKNNVTLLVSATDYNNRDQGANTFLITEGIKRYSKKGTIFNFGGSSIKSIANYFKSFNAKTLTYKQISQNKLSFNFKSLKKD